MHITIHLPQLTICPQMSPRSLGPWNQVSALRSARIRPIRPASGLSNRFFASQSAKESSSPEESVKDHASDSTSSSSAKSSPASSPRVDWEDNPNYNISQFSELPHSNFGVNQHIVINDEFKEALRRILWQFRAPIRYAFAYGSGVFPQSKQVRKVSCHCSEGILPFAKLLVCVVGFGWIAEERGNWGVGLSSPIFLALSSVPLSYQQFSTSQGDVLGAATLCGAQILDNTENPCAPYLRLT